MEPNYMADQDPKITFYSPEAKCMLMENDDFEIAFPTGEKISQTSNEIKIIEKDGASYSLESVGGASGLTPSVRELWELFQQRHHYCHELESTLTNVQTRVCGRYFPIICGTKPTWDQSCSPTPVMPADRGYNNAPIGGGKALQTLMSLQDLTLHNTDSTMTAPE